MVIMTAQSRSKDKDDILNEVHLVNSCLSESVVALFGLPLCHVRLASL